MGAPWDVQLARAFHDGGQRGFASFRVAQDDDCEEHRETAIPEGRERDHAADRHRPATVRQGAPDDQGDREREPHEERDGHRGPCPIAPRDIDQNGQPFGPGVGQRHDRHQDDERGRTQGDAEVPPLAANREPQQADTRGDLGQEMIV